MDTSTLWPLLKILLVFAIILLGIRCKTGIGASILLGSLLLALLFRVGFADWAAIGLRGVIQEKVLLLSLIVLLIFFLSDMLERTGQGRRLMDHVSRALAWPRLRLVFFPALIRPAAHARGRNLLRAHDQGHRRTPERAPPQPGLAELLVPARLGTLLAPVSGDHPGGIHRGHPPVPATGLHLAEPRHDRGPGLALLPQARRPALPLPPAVQTPHQDSHGSRLGMLRETLPLLIAVFGALGLEGLLVLLDLHIALEWGFAAALAAAMAFTAVQNRIPPPELLAVFRNRHALNMLFLVAAIFAFKSILEEGGVVGELAGSVTSASALFWVALLLPFLVGLTSGLTIAFVGGSLPLIIGLAGQLQIGDVLGYVVLALFSGYIGVLASPLHVCLILSCGYFHTSLESVLKKLAVPLALMLLFAAGYSLLLIGRA